MVAKLIAEQEIWVGEPSVVEGASPTPPFVVVFEDDGDTGYLYARDTSCADNPIVDALQIYNVAAVADRHLPSMVQLVWSQDGKKAALLTNRYGAVLTKDQATVHSLAAEQRQAIDWRSDPGGETGGG